MAGGGQELVAHPSAAERTVARLARDAMTATRELLSVTYESIDGVDKTKSFADIKQARKFAQHYLGETPELGSFYAVSGDGIGKITCSGCKLTDLFPRCA